MREKRYLLLSWVGRWVHEGPDHGRYPFFKSPEEALAWAEKVFVEGARPSDSGRFRVLEIEFPDPPPDREI